MDVLFLCNGNSTLWVSNSQIKKPAGKQGEEPAGYLDRKRRKTCLNHALFSKGVNVLRKCPMCVLQMLFNHKNHGVEIWDVFTP